MKKFRSILDKFFSPALILSYFALTMILLAVAENKLPLFLAALWGALSGAALRWGIWGILCLARKKATRKELKILTRTVEVILVLLTVAAMVVACLLWNITSVWLFLLTPLFGLQGAVKFDTRNF